jgi:RNA polymerase sigma-70 factor (ECF subfamily)
VALAEEKERMTCWPAGSPQFKTTQWSMVLTAANAGDGQAVALEQLCCVYWYPIYAYIRWRGHGPADAQDLTQEFFARLLEKRWLEDIEPDAGRFRSFLLTAVNRFLANEHDRAQALKRGGGQQFFSLDQEAVETRYLLEPATEETPDKVFDRRWALTVLDQALRHLREETVAAGKARQMELLNPFLSRDAGPGEYAAVAAKLGTNAGAVGVAVHRLRQRYREIVREIVAGTLVNALEIDREMQDLFAALRG